MGTALAGVFAEPVCSADLSGLRRSNCQWIKPALADQLPRDLDGIDPKRPAVLQVLDDVDR